MTRDDIRAVFFEEIDNIAPGEDLDSLPQDDDIREALDLDSMDMLNLVTALHERLQIEIPEADVPSFVTVAGALDYLAAKLGS